MEHPGRNWNRIECWCNQFLGRLLPSRALRWLWVLGHTAAGGYILLLTLFGSLGYSVFLGWPIHKLCQEQIVEADPAIVNPANEGRLVRLSGELTTSEWVTDPLTGVQARTPWLERTPGSPLPRARETSELCNKTFYAKEWQLGAFRITHYRPDGYHASEAIPAKELQFTQPAEGYQVSLPQPWESSVLLSTAQGEPVCTISYHNYTQPVYIVARQHGNQLLLDDPAATFSFYQPSDFSPETTFCAFMLCLGSGIHFAMLCLAFSCLRSAMWHASGGKDLFRLPLALASGLVVGISCCLNCGIFLLSGKIFLIYTTVSPDCAYVPGVLFLISGLALLACLWKRWKAAAASQAH